MTPEEQRIAIAEACGLNPQNSPLDAPRANLKGWFTPAGYDDYRFAYPHGMCVRIIPDYLNDLNAMHEAEKILGDNIHLYTIELIRVLGWNTRKYPTFILIHATAAQRAEAFLRAKGLWKD